MKILVDPRTAQFLGASMIGIRCDKVAHGIIYLMHAGGTRT